MPRATAAATRALELDDTLAEAHTAMGIGYMMYAWEWDKAEREFLRAIELNPQYAVTYTLYSLFYVAFGRFDEALAMAKHAAQTDPLSPLAQMAPAWTLYFARRFRESLDYLRQLMSVNPNFTEARSLLMFNYEQLGEFERAGEAMIDNELFARLPPDEMRALVSTAAAGGHQSYWEARLRMLDLPWPQRAPLRDHRRLCGTRSIRGGVCPH